MVKKSRLAVFVVVSVLVLSSCIYLLTSYLAPRHACNYSGYLVYEDATTVFALNCNTGTVDFSGADAAAVINSAISNLGHGGIVHVNAGMYTLSTSIVGELNDVVFEGDGRATVFNVVQNFSMCGICPSGSGWVIRNFRFDGTNMNRTNNNHAIRPTGNNITITGLFVNNWDGVGIYVFTGNRITITNNVLYGWNSGDGIGVLKSTDDIISNNLVESVTKYNGIFVAGSSNVSIVGNVVDGGGNGIGIENIGQQGINEYITIAGNTVRNTNYGVKVYLQNVNVDSGRYVTITGNTFIPTRLGKGIYITSGRFFTITGNTIVGGTAGVYLENSVSNITVTGNFITDSIDFGIREDASGTGIPDYNFYTGNYFNLPATAIQIQLAGTHSRAANNYP